MRTRLGVLACGILLGCGGGGEAAGPPPPPPPVPVATVSVEPGTSTLFVGASQTLSATVRDASGNALSGRSITWASNNTAVATVSTTGVVTAVAPGTASITATSEGRSGSAQVTVQAPVATVAVAPATLTLLPGATGTLTATPQDAGGAPLSGRSITWASSNTAVATVSTTGVVTAVAPGQVLITATSEGKTGSATATVLPPVTSVVITGNFRVKVGDTYAYTATARIADGTIVTRPVTWSVTNPARATMTPGGAMLPLLPGAITIRATIDGIGWDVAAAAYDWQAFGSGTTQGVYLVADNTITNKFGTSEYPELTIGCTQGSLLIFVDTDHFVTANGNVVYSFDGGTVFSRTWVESTDFSALIFPSTSNATNLAFASLIAASRAFGFGFTEFNAGAKVMVFRVTGMGPQVSAMLPSCALANTRIASGPADLEGVNALRAAAGKPLVHRTDLAAREIGGAVQGVVPSWVTPRTMGTARSAVRQRQ